MASTRALFEILAAGDEDEVIRVVTADPELVQARDAEGATPLHHAALHGRRDLARFLIETGADANARDGRWGATPAGWAIEYLRKHGGLLAIEMGDLFRAVRRGDTDWVRRWLARFPALASCVDAQGRTALDRALEAGSQEIVRLLTGEEDVQR